MKKALVLILLAVITLICVFCGQTSDMVPANSAYLRIHIRADSNDAAAQAVKYRVRDAVVDFLTPRLASAVTREAAVETVTANLTGIEAAACRTLKENGFSYGARAELRREEFPTRVYGELTLPAGVYDALILELGSGEGDNWWCVVYPPLCFTSGGGSVVYRSKIAEIVQNFFDGK